MGRVRMVWCLCLRLIVGHTASIQSPQTDWKAFMRDQVQYAAPASRYIDSFLGGTLETGRVEYFLFIPESNKFANKHDTDYSTTEVTSKSVLTSEALDRGGVLGGGSWVWAVGGAGEAALIFWDRSTEVNTYSREFRHCFHWRLQQHRKPHLPSW